MRLLQRDSTGRFSLTADLADDDDKFPLYAILSHTWVEDQEVTFDDIQNDNERTKEGYKKLEFCAQQAEQDGLRYFWVDTCCINKANAAELQHAINSMFRWYQSAIKCYVYLPDVSTASQSEPSQQEWEPAFRSSRWFTRGWTLQELLAPHSVTFFSREGRRLGDRTSLKLMLHEITGIASRALEGCSLHEIDVEERLSWMERRQTTRKEDKAYSLLGIFNIFMPLIYGEGETNAFRRLRKEINESMGHHLHQQTEIVQEKSKAPWMVPFARPLSFVGRSSFLTQISAHVSSKGGKGLTIYGLGGCGKTALALEAAYQTREQQPLCSIFWVPAVSRESFKQAFQEIGVLLRIPGILDKDNDAQLLVKEKLSDEAFGPWLIIVDNADDTSILFGSGEGSHDANRLIDYLPYSRQGSVIFTTRTRLAAVELSGVNSIALGQLEILEATDVLETRLLQEHRHELRDKCTVNEFLDMLACFALAIVQAAAFINKNDITLKDYISHYRGNERDATELLSKEFEDQGRYRETENPIATTWYMSFEHLRKHNEEAVYLLSFMSCMANNDIPESLLPANSNKLKRAEAIGALKAYAFISERLTQIDGQQEHAEKPLKTFDVHPLVHLAMRGWLRAHDQWIPCIIEALQHMLEAVPYDEIKETRAWIPYLPHASYLAHIPELLMDEDTVELLARIDLCYSSLGRYAAAEQHNREAFKRSEELFGRTDRATQNHLRSIAISLMNRGRFEEAGPILRETIAVSKEVNGERDPITLRLLDDLATMLRGLGRYTEAMKMQEEQLVLSREIFGEKHPDTIRRMGLLARSYYLNTMYPEAQTTYNEQVRLSKEVWGETHAKTIDSMSDLASVLREIGDHAEAEHLYREALALLQKTYGKEYPATLTAMNNLGLTLTYSRQYTEAEALLKKGLLLEEKVRGKGNQEALVVMHNLAFLYTDQGRYSDAEELYQETLELHSGMYAPDHPEVLMSLEGLADALIGQGRHEEAFSLYQRVYNSRKKVLGSGNQRTRWARRKYLRTKKLLLGNNSADESDDDLSEYASSDNEGSTTEGHSASEANETIGEATAEFGNLETAESPNTRTSKNESFVVGDDNTPEPVPSQKLPRQGIPAVSSDGTKHNAPQPPHAGDETSLHQKTSAEIGHKPITTGPKSTSSNTSEPPGEEIPEFTNTTTSQEKQIQILSTDSELSATTILSSQSTSLQGPPAQQIPPDQSSAPPAGNRETQTLKSESEQERSEGARSSEVALRSKDKWRQRLNRIKFTR